MRIKNIGFWSVLFSIIALIFSPAIIYPFFQDDFFALVTTKITSFGGVFRLFLPAAEAVYWRPLGIQLYFGVMQFLGLGQPIWFHLVSLAVHLLNTYLVYRLTLSGLDNSRGFFPRQRRGQNDGDNRGRHLAFLTAFLWGVSPIHYFALGWAVNFSFILVVTWSILAILAVKEGNIFRAILFLILGLMTNEMAVVIPLLVILLNGGKRLAAPMLSAVAGYVVWRILSGVKIEGDYSLSLVTVFSTLRWYGLWMLGWSDIVRDFIRWGVIFTPEFVNTFPAVVTVYLVEVVVLGRYLLLPTLRAVPRYHFLDTLGLGSSLISSSPLGHPKSKVSPGSSSVVSKMTSSGQPVGIPEKYFLWVIIGLLPVLFFQKHLYSHYAAIAAIGFYWWLAEIAVARRLEMVMAVVWIMAAFTTMGLNYRVSWMADHAANSGKFQSMVREQMPSELVSRIYIVSGGLKVQTVLLGGYGVEYLTGVDRNKVIFVSSIDEMTELHDDEAVIFL